MGHVYNFKKVASNCLKVMSSIIFAKYYVFKNLDTKSKKQMKFKN
jgi:hypothetical protein